MVVDSVLIFGGTQGIGKILAKHFLGKAYSVTVASRSNNHLEALEQEIGERRSILHTIAADVIKEDHVQRAFEAHKAVFGETPGIVICTAALQGPIGPLWTLSSGEWRKIVEVNLIGSFFVTKSAINTMLPKGSGSIIHFSGGGAANARPNFSAYGISKTGLLRLVETAAEELKSAGHMGIIINAIAPGAVKTGMTLTILEHADRAGEKERKDAESILQSKGTPPEQIISLVEFLCDPKANRGISGRLIHVRDDYMEFVKKFNGDFSQDAGRLRRIPLR